MPTSRAAQSTARMFGTRLTLSATSLAKGQSLPPSARKSLYGSTTSSAVRCGSKTMVESGYVMAPSRWRYGAWDNGVRPGSSPTGPFWPPGPMLPPGPVSQLPECQNSVGDTLPIRRMTHRAVVDVTLDHLLGRTLDGA